MLPADGNYSIRVYLMSDDRDSGRTMPFMLSNTIIGGTAVRRTAVYAVAGALALAACDEMATTGTDAVDSGLPSPAQAACMSAVARETGNGNVTVVGSGGSLTGTELIIGVGEDRTPWRCLASNDGVVEEVSSMVDEGAA